jgi:tungstate transport system permease protein
MGPLWEAIRGALGLIASGDPALATIVLLSLEVKPVGCPVRDVAWSAARRRHRGCTLSGPQCSGGAAQRADGPAAGRRRVVRLPDAFSRRPLGALGILFTPGAMVLAQTILVLPIIAALCRQAVEDAWIEYEEQLRSLGARGPGAALTLVWDNPVLAAHCDPGGTGPGRPRK